MPHSGGVQGQAGCDFKEPDLLKGVSARAGGWNEMIFKGPFHPKPFCDSLKIAADWCSVKFLYSTR